MMSLLHSILVMAALTITPFVIGFWCGKLYQREKNAR